ncbi:hypothetical protein I79_004274 [Cricetulus griseus]|uniref:Uncharacterized protein n=1 Tax=Cricetulus griseus TaxID=10029 RepID=G3H2A3_CRIGR|nr:hypothetical protein I79_004274 [Cricetulus griseus]
MGNWRQHSVHLTCHEMKCITQRTGGANGICNVTTPCARPKVISTLTLNACPVVFSVLQQPHCPFLTITAQKSELTK